MDDTGLKRFNKHCPERAGAESVFELWADSYDPEMREEIAYGDYIYPGRFDHLEFQNPTIKYLTPLTLLYIRSLGPLARALADPEEAFDIEEHFLETLKQYSLNATWSLDELGVAWILVYPLWPQLTEMQGIFRLLNTSLFVLRGHPCLGLSSRKDVKYTIHTRIPRHLHNNRERRNDTLYRIGRVANAMNLCTMDEEPKKIREAQAVTYQWAADWCIAPPKTTWWQERQ